MALSTRTKAALDDAFVWYKSLRDTSNTAFLSLYNDRHRYLVLKGGAGSGKSNFAAHKVLDRCVREGGHRFLCCRKVKEDIRKSIFEQLLALAAQYYPGMPIEANRTNFDIRFPSGSVIYCVGLNDVSRLKSIYEITDIWIEEATEISESDFGQLDIRMRGKSPHYRQMILTFNPVSVTHWLKKRFFDAPDARCRVHESSYKDNRYLDAEDILTLEQFRETDPYYYEVYCLGHWGSTYRSIFPTDKVIARQDAAPKPLRIGLFEGGRFCCAADGFIKIYAEPRAGRPYVCGADTAGEGSDFFAAHVIDNVTGEQVAVLHGRMDETAFPGQLAALGRMYNDALLAVECNFSTYTVHELDRIGYRHQYIRESFDSYSGSYKKAYGFVTTKITRPVILGDLLRIFSENPTLVNDTDTLEEFLTFIRNDKLRPEAAVGAHDDLVLSLAIAYHAREQQSREDETALVEWTHSMWEDYRAARSDIKAELIQKWGKPKPERKRR